MSINNINKRIFTINLNLKYLKNKKILKNN